MPCRPSFMSPIDLLGFTAELNLTLAELLSVVQPTLRNVFQMSPRLHCRKKTKQLIEYTKAWTPLILKINVSKFDLSAKCASHQLWNQWTIHWAREKMNAIKSFFLSLLTVILSFSYHVSVVVTIFWCIQSFTDCCVFHLFWKLLPLGKKAKQNKTIATGQTLRNPILSTEVWNSQALIWCFKVPKVNSETIQ